MTQGRSCQSGPDLSNRLEQILSQATEAASTVLAYELRRSVSDLTVSHHNVTLWHKVSNLDRAK